MAAWSRRQFVATGAALAASRGVAGAAERPLNVLFLLTDQHHAGVLGCAGNPLVQTPHLDRLAAAGVRFATAYCPTPFCSPTRCSLLTGNYPHANGMVRNIDGGQVACTDPLRLVEPLVTWQHRLAEHGYRCHHLGKYHLGNPAELRCFPTGRADQEEPAKRLHARRREAGDAAFDAGPRPGEELVGNVFLTASQAAVQRAWAQDPKRTPQDVSIIGRSRFRAAYHLEEHLADYTAELLRGYREQPWSLTLSVSPPHALWVAPAPYYDQYDPAAFTFPASWTDRRERDAGGQARRLAERMGEANVREYFRCYYAQVTWMDALFGRVLAALDESGQADRTLVIYASDHGDLQGAHCCVDKSVNTCYEEIARVPLILRLPGGLPAGQTVTAPCSLVDLPPTILDYLAAPPLGPVHGRSLRPLVEGRETADRLVIGQRGQPTGRGLVRMVRRGPWKLTVYGTGERELYEVAEDAAELRNRAADPAAAGVVRDLSRALTGWMRETGDPAAAALQPLLRDVV